MLNWIWAFLFAAGSGFAAVSGNLALVGDAAFDAAAGAVQLVLELSGLLALWMGMFRIAEAAGLVNALGRLVSPFVRLLFPSVPKGHPALSAIVMNFSANLLGLGNAATPFGLKAMEELEKLNPKPGTATPAMITLLVMNTTGVTLLPATVISLRTAAGSANPACILPAAFLASVAGFSFALLLDAIIRFWKGRDGQC